MIPFSHKRKPTDGLEQRLCGRQCGLTLPLRKYWQLGAANVWNLQNKVKVRAQFTQKE
jgi:hypothetical protein